MASILPKACLQHANHNTLVDMPFSLCQEPKYSHCVPEGKIRKLGFHRLMATKKVKLKSNDGEIFLVEEEIACESHTLKHLIEDGYNGDEIPLLQLSSNVLALVIDYCKYRKNRMDSAKSHPPSVEDELKDCSFITNIDPQTLCGLIMAANFLNIKSLLDLTCKVAADLIKGKTTREIRAMLDIKNDLTPEEEERVRWETCWGSKELQKRYLYSNGGRGTKGSENSKQS